MIIYHHGEELKRFDYLVHSRGMVMLSENVLADESLKISDTVRQWALEVARRQVSIYHEIIQGGIN